MRTIHETEISIDIESLHPGQCDGSVQSVGCCVAVNAAAMTLNRLLERSKRRKSIQTFSFDLI